MSSGFEQIFGLWFYVFSINLWLMVYLHLRSCSAESCQRKKMGCHPLLVVINMTGEETTVSKTTWKERRCETFKNRTGVGDVWPTFFVCFYFVYIIGILSFQSCEILFLSGNCLFTEFCCLHTFAMLIKWYELCILLLWGNKINCLIFLCAFVCPFSEPRNKRAS